MTVLFLPQPNGLFVPTTSFQSVLTTGTTVITDNTFTPFGGFYPEEVEVRREPMIRSPERLLKLHERRLRGRGSKEVVFETDAIEDFNRHQEQLERVNLEQGFLTARQVREEEGRLSREGRYRLWREMWTLGYLGLASRYRD